MIISVNNDIFLSKWRKGGFYELYFKAICTPLLAFSATTDTSDPEIEIFWCDESKKNLLPLDMESNSDSLRRWLLRRTIPRNRAYVHNLLAKCGLNLNRPMNILDVCKGLSLNDCYWVVHEDDTATFAEVNLYENPFSNVWRLWHLQGTEAVRALPCDPARNSPQMECCPNAGGRIGGKVYLYKGGTVGASNAGFEPYSEYYAAQVAQTMGISSISYGLSRWKGTLCSTCELFTSPEISFLPVGRLVTKGGMPAVIAYYEDLGPEFLKALHEMMVFDAVICNVDRHFGNFGLLIENRTNRIISPAPLFDHGNSLFNFAGKDCWENEAVLEDYIGTLVPSVYDDFLGTARRVMSQEIRSQVRHLLTFKFQKHSRYNPDVQSSTND